MKKLALGIVAANAIVASTSFAALAQIGVHAGPGGFDVELGGPGVYYGPRMGPFLLSFTPITLANFCKGKSAQRNQALGGCV